MTSQCITCTIPPANWAWSIASLENFFTIVLGASEYCSFGISCTLSGHCFWEFFLKSAFYSPITVSHSWCSIFHALYTGAEDLPALWPADGSVGEEGGANGEQPQTQSQGEQDTGVLWKAIPWDTQAERAAGALPEVINYLWLANILTLYHYCAAIYVCLFLVQKHTDTNRGFLYFRAFIVVHWKGWTLFSYRLRLKLRIIFIIY